MSMVYERPVFVTGDSVPPDAGAVAAVKGYLRIEDGTEDALIARLVASAIGHGEGFTGQALIVRNWAETLRPDGGWRRLSRGPVRTMAGVASVPATGEGAALAAGAFAIDIDGAGDGWVRVLDAGGAARVRVTYAAGLASGWAALPEPIAQGVVRLAAHLFTHRDARDEGAPPAAIAALWRPWRRMRLMSGRTA